MRLGHRQIDLLSNMVGRRMLLTPNRTARRLCELGLLQGDDDGARATITAAGLRALADAADAGRVDLGAGFPCRPTEDETGDR